VTFKDLLLRFKLEFIFNEAVELRTLEAALMPLEIPIFEEIVEVDKEIVVFGN